MIEVYADLWELHKAMHVAVTTNGSTRKDGKLVMGRGCAEEAVGRFPSLPLTLGMKVASHGNHVYRNNIPGYLYAVYSFPVKMAWQDDASMALIERSCRELVREVSSQLVAIPRPGCGFGRLEWKDVRKLISPLLPDNVLVVHFPPKE